MNITDTQIRAWAERRGYPVPENQPVPEWLREKYRQARNYMIRRTYAMRSGKHR